ncbi:hypothetical protein P154DRAFT_516963 [Amniculicola lignicola CBS 123094]|uniref:Uncharacterized protein n=1 Tax=Amniculicola lignicola CBS 123094 TaxID=1392246 RepID=A0A6A5X2H5_9PLEO|nr:hypothetical protein P154DRAFT_516963 [Amniculicola lignicola CBS 123094]
MGTAKLHVDPAHVVQSLVSTLLDVFDATRDLYATLRAKEKREYEHNLRSRGYSESRKFEIADEDISDNDLILDKAAVTRTYEDGVQDIGVQFAIGDVVSQTGLQSQIITLQSVLITTFMYGPSSLKPISHHLSNLVAASRVAGTSSVDILAAQHQRQLSIPPPSSRARRSSISTRHSPLYPATVVPTTHTHSTALVKSRRSTAWPDESAHTNPTTTSLSSRPKPPKTDTESTDFTGLTSYVSSTPSTLYCPYALDLQKHPSQLLASAVTSNISPYCPHCRRILHLTPGRSWEIFKDDEGAERCFRVQNRFVVKCHRESADGGYSCILCTRSGTMDTVCGDVKALIQHVWKDHGAGELELEEDVLEIVDNKAVDRRRRDSGLSIVDSKGGGVRRAMSLGSPSRPRRRRPTFEREVKTLEVWSPRESA